MSASLSPSHAGLPPLLPRPKQVLFSLSYLTFKVSASVFLQRLNFVTRQIKEMEEELVNSEEEIDLWDIFSPKRAKHEWNVWQNFYPRVRLGVIFEICVQSLYKVEQLVASRVCTPSTFRKLFKSVPDSAVRKSSLAAFRGWSQPVLAYKVFVTAFRGQVMYWTALFVVSLAFDLANVLPPAPLPPQQTTLAPVRSTSTFQQRVSALLFKCCFGCALAALGASLGTLIRPGFGTNLGMLALSSLSK